MHRRSCGVDAFQSVTVEHCEDRVSLVHNQPPSSSATAVTALGRFRPHFTSFRRSRPWNLHRQRGLDEVSLRENGIGLLLGIASTADYPSVSVERPVLQSLVSSLVLSRLDYGNSTLTGVSSHLLSRLQSVMNAAARLIFSSVEVPAHHSAPSSAALAEGSRADCIQTISPRTVQVSTRVRTCIPY